MLKIVYATQIGIVTQVYQHPQQSISSTPSMNMPRAIQYPANGPRKEMVITVSKTARNHLASQKANAVQAMATGHQAIICMMKPQYN